MSSPIHDVLAAQTGVQVPAQPPPPPGPLFGVDLSSHQSGINLEGIRAEGFDFAFCKISQGAGYRSPDWPRQRDTARQSGLILAGYHYVDGADPAAQAANCKAWIGDTTIPVALDCEANGGDISHYHAILDAFAAAGLRVALSYLPHWYWQQIGSPDLRGIPPLWSSRYPGGTRAAYASQLYQAVGAQHWAGYGGASVAVLQFTASAVVQGLHVDANAFPGSRDELLALLTGTTPTPAAGPEQPPLRIREDAMYIKCQPDKSKPDVVTAMWNGPMFVAITSQGELASAEAEITAGAGLQWVEWATWQELDRRSHQLCDPPAPVAVDAGAVQAAVSAALGGGLAMSGSISGQVAPKVVG